MRVQGLQTHKIAPGERVKAILKRYLPKKMPEGVVVGITSKLLSYAENRLVPKEKTHKEHLIKEEAQAILNCERNPYDVCITIKDNIMMATAGIDESNARGCYVLLPQNVMASAQEIWEWISREWQLKHVGVVITDSQSSVLRRGVRGIGIGFCGFEPLYSYCGKPDLDGRVMTVSQLNVVDGLASACVMVMGEGNEQTPLAIIEDIPRIQFKTVPPSEAEREAMRIQLNDDLFLPLLAEGKWETLGS